jgi:hypothetical protein
VPAGALLASGATDAGVAGLRSLITERPTWEVIVRGFADKVPHRAAWPAVHRHPVQWPVVRGSLRTLLAEGHGVVAVGLLRTSSLSTTPRCAASRAAGYRYQRSPSNSKPIDSCPHRALTSISHSMKCCRFPV